MQRMNNVLGLLLLIKRSLSVSSFRGNKHYTFRIRHIKTEVNNCSYIVKKTTAIPKKTNYCSTIAYGNILPNKLKLDTFYNNPALIKTGNLQSISSDNKITNIREDVFYMQELIDRLIFPKSVKEIKNNDFDASETMPSKSKNLNCSFEQSGIQSIISDNNNQVANMALKEVTFESLFKSEYVKSNKSIKTDIDQIKTPQDYLDLNEIDRSDLKKISHPPVAMEYHSKVANESKDSNIVSCNEIKDLVMKKMMEFMFYNSKLKDISSENILVLNPDNPAKTTFIYFNGKGVHIIEPPHEGFCYEIKNYLKKVDQIENSGLGKERINFIKFDKVPTLNSCFSEIIPISHNVSTVPTVLDNTSELQLRKLDSDLNSSNEKNDCILKVQQSFSVENDSDKSWISYEEGNPYVLPREEIESSEEGFKQIRTNMVEEENKKGGSFSILQLDKELSPKSEPPFTENLPINKDKLIEEATIPNTSILSIINSIDRSAVIIQKDLYITDQIIQKIQKEEEKEKQKIVEKNKLETMGSKTSHVLCLDIHSAKDDKITFSLSDITKNIKKDFLEYLQNKEIRGCTGFSSEVTNACIDRPISTQEEKEGHQTDNHSTPDILELKEKSAKQSIILHSLENRNTGLKKTKHKVGSVQQNNYVFNYNEDSHSSTDDKSNQTYITFKNWQSESGQKDEKTEIVFVSDLDKQNTAEKCINKNDIVPTQIHILNDSSLSNDLKFNSLFKNAQCPSKMENNFKGLKSKLNDLGLFVTLDSIDSDGNMVFNILDKTDKVVTKLSLISEKNEIKAAAQGNKLFCSVNEDPLQIRLFELNNNKVSLSGNSSNNCNSDQNIAKDKPDNLTNPYSIGSHKHHIPCPQLSLNKNLKNELGKNPGDSKQITGITQQSGKHFGDHQQKIFTDSHRKTNSKTNKINHPQQVINQDNTIHRTSNLKNSSSDEMESKQLKQGNLMSEEQTLPIPIKSKKLLPDQCSGLDNTAQGLFGNNNDIKHNIYIPKRKKFGGMTANPLSNKTVDHITKTTISSIKKNNFIDINVSEVETFVDSRLPIPFSTETFFQIFGSNSLLRGHSSVIDVAKYKLTSDKHGSYPTNIDVMAKLDDIQKGITKLSILAKEPVLQNTKVANSTNKSLIPSKEITHRSNYEVIQNNNDNRPVSKNAVVQKGTKVSSFHEKLSLKTNKQSKLPTKHNHVVQIEQNKFNQPLSKIKAEIKKQDDNKGSLIPDKKILLVVNKNEKTNKINKPLKEKMKDPKEIPLNKELRKTKVNKSRKHERVNYIDIFNIYKNEKERKRLKFTLPKKSLYDHKGLSKRDKKILREITKEIPKQKSSRQKTKRRPLRTIPNKKSEKEMNKQLGTIKSNKPKSLLREISKPNPDNNTKISINSNVTKRGESPVKIDTKLLNAPSETNKIVLPPRKIENQEKIEPKKFADINKMKSTIDNKTKMADYNQPTNYQKKNYDSSNKESATLMNKTSENTNIQLEVKKQTNKKQLTRDIEKPEESETKLKSAQMFDNANYYHSKTQEKSPKLKLTQKNVISDYDDRKRGDEKCNKPLCHTYIATEAYINQPEKISSIPDKSPLSFPKLSKIVENNPDKYIPPPQKVTILEKYNKVKEAYSNQLEVPEGFKQNLIKKSQEKIEQKSNIDFRVKTPKTKNPKSKLKLLNANTQKGGKNPFSVTGKGAPIKKQLQVKKKQETEKNKFTPKLIRNKLNNKSLNASNMTNKFPTTLTKSRKDKINKKELSLKHDTEGALKDNSAIKKTDIPKHDSGIHNKETFTESNPQVIEVASIKHSVSPVKQIGTSKEQVTLKNNINDTSKASITQEPKLIPLEKVSNSNFPMLLIDVDKMSKEIKPDLDLKNCQKCSVSLDKIDDFPLLNPRKKSMFSSPSRILCLGPSRDPMLRKELNFFPSVTKILNSTIPDDSRERLREWRSNMITNLGENGFKSFYKSQLTNGSQFHSQLHDHLFNGINIPNDSLHSSMKSIQNVLNKLTDLCAVNSHVVHRKLAYRGVVDCIAKYQNKPVLIEWKRVENPQVKVQDSSLHVASVQLAAYTGAVNYDDAYKFQLYGGLIVVAYNDGSEAEVIEIPRDQCLIHWKAWLKRLQQFHESVHMKQN